MGKKIKDLTSSGGDEDRKIKRKRKLEEEAQINGEVIETPEISASKKSDKKKKKKEKKNGKEAENTQLENGSKLSEGFNGESGKKKKKKEEKRDGEVGEEEKKSYGVVVVSGKNSGDSKYAPLSSFADSKLPDNVLECCKGFAKPSPIQAHAWPFLLDNRDLIGIAQTGSGKTLAFGIPAIMHVLGKRKDEKSRRVNPLCLFLSPTRELAQQIADVLCDAGKSCGIKTACFYGGTSKGPQLSALKSGIDIAIGTPGRLKDLIEMGACRLQDVSFVVLDEADRMLDMGFEQDVRSILSKTNSARQMVMFSATWPMEVHQLAQEFMDPNPIKVVVGSEDLAANHDVMQIVEVLEENTRDRRLVALLDKYHESQKNRVIVFVLYQKEGDRVERMLQGRGWNVVAIHAGKPQSTRTKSLALFKSGTCPLLIATDVAARGLDIPDVEVVINYSFPLTTEDYVHRIGRTGRAGKKGVAHTFFTKENKGLAGELVNVLREANQHIPPDLVKFGTHVKKKESKLYGAHFREITADAPKATKITFADSDDE
ncbi:DEAD-box ATP-dependent RNA helicase 5-like [Chenopodium quinoa]|uniref:DEAD-box ATP-dependent RNA helicase 5-like n=1 Tax=Chenopodium quinoa TaxID=63459 RepID=UPI000B77F9D7|nr:DEAD-box ATP-dependent RNA helicase 5-like [Chenopodium quinoa]